MSHVDTKRDLLHVGLCCKQLHSIVFPRHFEYRLIRCKVSSISIWNHLVIHKSLARNVRRLEILDERCPSSSSNGGRNDANNGMVIPKGVLEGDTDLESTDDELGMHNKQERYFVAALMRMAGLKEFKWACNHSPISVQHIWPVLMTRCVALQTVEICDNLIFASQVDGNNNSDSGSEGEVATVSRPKRKVQAAVGVISFRFLQPSHSCPTITQLSKMTSVVFRSTAHSYGSSKHPDLSHISHILNQCPHLKNLEVTYTSSRASNGGATAQQTASSSRPSGDELLMYSRWINLTSVVLTNLRCGSTAPLAAFLWAHRALEVLHLDINVGAAGFRAIELPDDSLPNLREIKAPKDMVNAVITCPSTHPRPLETIKGFKLAGGGNNTSSHRAVSDGIFLGNLRRVPVRRIEMIGWHDMDDIKRLVAAIPGVTHLDIGKRIGSREKERAVGPVTNMVEWAELLSNLPELIAVHGIKFFYEVAAVGVAGSISAAGPTCIGEHLNNRSDHGVGAIPGKTLQLSMMERSRMRKNDEIAGVLAWKCSKLRRVDHWECSEGGKVVVLLRDESGKGRWEVRRLIYKSRVQL